MENFLSKLEDGHPAEINREKKNKTRKVVSSVNDVGNDIDVPVYVGQRYDGSDRACFAFQ